jgi:hypothetical protein
MDWLQFISAIIGHVAWPTVMIVLFVILRKHMGALADRVLEFSFAGAKITFDKYLVKGAELIAESPAPQLPSPEEPQLNLERSRSVETNPRKEGSYVEQPVRNYLRKFLSDTRKEKMVNLIRVLTSLDEIDRMLFDIGDLMGIDVAEASSVMYSLLAQKKIPKSMFGLYQTLRSAKEVIEHTHALPDQQEVSEYMRQTNFLKKFLELLKAELSASSPTNKNPPT